MPHDGNEHPSGEHGGVISRWKEHILLDQGQSEILPGSGICCNSEWGSPAGTSALVIGFQ